MLKFSLVEGMNLRAFPTILILIKTEGFSRGTSLILLTTKNLRSLLSLIRVNIYGQFSTRDDCSLLNTEDFGFG